MPINNDIRRMWIDEMAKEYRRELDNQIFNILADPDYVYKPIEEEIKYDDVEF